MQKDVAKEKMILQLHITGKCNLRCKHCYIDEHSCEMSFEAIEKVLHQFDKLTGERNVKAALHVTGGEPFVHSEIDKIADLLLENKEKYSIGIMSNGTLLDNAMLEKLCELKLDGFQVSLDGSEKTHDEIRGEGNFKDVVSSLDKLHLWGIPTRVSFTANKKNYNEFPEVATVCREHHVGTLWSDRYIPVIGEKELKPIPIEEMRSYVSILQKEWQNILNAKAGLRVENYRALQFLESGAEPYWCKAGEELIVVDEHGNIMPCRRLPIVCGNIETTTLEKVYFEHPVFLKLREHEVGKACKGCRHEASCKGGSRCMAYAVKGDFTCGDPGCYMGNSEHLSKC